MVTEGARSKAGQRKRKRRVWLCSLSVAMIKSGETRKKEAIIEAIIGMGWEDTDLCDNCPSRLLLHFVPLDI
jgi:hypothetical protein